MRDDKSKRTGKEDPREEIREKFKKLPREKLIWLDGFIAGMVTGSKMGGEKSA